MTRYNDMLRPLQMPIEELDLPCRIYSNLKREGIIQVGQVLAMDRTTLLSIRNFGQGSYDRLQERLKERGFKEHMGILLKLKEGFKYN